MVSWASAGNGRAGELIKELDQTLKDYTVSVIDAGTIRLDASMFSVVRPSDPIVVVVRHRHTERLELQNTVDAMRLTNHSVAGVILNRYKTPVPVAFLREFLGVGGMK
jgi:Mrp family chromosome partitioning ATPase